MMTPAKIVLCLVLLAALPASAQKRPVKHKQYGHGVVAVAPPPEIFTYVEQQPEFVGGSTALDKFLDANLRYPLVARENEIMGRVIVRFMVAEDGTVAHAKVLRGIGAGCDEEALRVVKAMPRWRPGKVNGKPVRAMYVLPITFKLI
jgi:protein TonB